MRKLFIFLITILFLAILFFFFFNKAKNNTPLSSYSQTEEYQQDTSQLVLPIEIDIASFEPVFNQQMEETEWFYEETGIEVNKNLSISYRVKKEGFAQLFPQDDKIQLRLPLYIEILPKGSGIYKLGLGKNTTLKAKVDLESAIKTDLDENWDLVSDAQTKFVIKESPSLNIAGISIDFNKQLQQNLELGVDQINKEIESQIQQAIDTKQIIELIWEEIKTPYHIDAEPFDAWAMLTPTDVAFTELKPVGPGTIGTTFWVNSLLDIEAGKRPIKINTKRVPKAVKKKDLPNAYTHLNFPLIVPFDSFIRYLNDLEEPLSFSIPGNRTLTLSNFSATAINGQLIVESSFVSGSIKGTLNLKGLPVFEASNQTISVKINSISTDSNNRVVDNLVNTIQKNNTVKQKIEEQMTYSIHDDLADLNFEITNQLKNTKLHEYAKLDGYINNTKINGVFVKDNHFLLATEVEAGLKCIVQAEGSSLRSVND